MQNGDTEIDNANKIGKFYYSLLKERQNWLMDKMELGLKKYDSIGVVQYCHIIGTTYKSDT